MSMVDIWFSFLQAVAICPLYLQKVQVGAEEEADADVEAAGSFVRGVCLDESRRGCLEAEAEDDWRRSGELLGLRERERLRTSRP